MKKTYHKPETRVVFLPSPVLMLGGSNTVNEYEKKDINVGDVDEPYTP